MKKLLIVAGIVLIGYFGYKKMVNVVFTDEVLAQSMTSANKDRPKTVANGAVLEKMETRPGLVIIQPVTLPVAADRINMAAVPKDSAGFCGDSMGRYFLDHGVTMRVVWQDNAGTSMREDDYTAADCR